jgi:methylmalonyl-CoA mutase, N-terminal domain
VDERLVQRARDRLGEVRSRRDGAAVGRAREALRRGADGSADLFPLILAAVEADVTLGEISDDLRGVFGTYRPRP